MASIYKRGGRRNRGGRYRISYFDEFGQRRDVTAGTSDRDTAKQIADKLEADAALRRRGVITPQEDRLGDLNATPLAEHVTRYIAHCRRQKQDDVHVGNKETQLNLLLASTGAKAISELTREAVQRHLDGLADAGKSARTVNQHKTTIVTFVGWCYAGVDVHANPLAKMPRFNEEQDRRRVRRALTDNELARLVAVPEAIEAGRADYYTVATLLGLRSGDARGLVWGDVDLDAATLRIRVEVGKSRREDHLPIHPQALAVLARNKPPFARPTDNVFPAIPRVKTFHRDCQRAQIERYDAQGHQLDLHALGRTTFGTRLANSGVMPQMAAKLMRHADVKITMKHYTKLLVSDGAKAVSALAEVVPGSAQHKVQHSCGLFGQSLAGCGTVEKFPVMGSDRACRTHQPVYNPQLVNVWQSLADGGRENDDNCRNDKNLRAIGAAG